MTTVLGIITQAMRRAGILTKTEPPSADEAADALITLNQMLSSWSNDSMMISSRTVESFNLIGGQATYTIGSGQDFDTARPTYIVSVYTRLSSIDYPVLEMTDEVYAENIAMKSIQGRPEFYNYTNSYPNGVFKLWPVPDMTYQMFIVMEKTLSEFTLNQTVSLPSGWEMALVYNLAILLAPEYDQQPSGTVVLQAEQSKDSIRRAILKSRTMDAAPMAINTTNNIYSGFFSN